jgi:DNA-directed RNA polymerase II subunit RPB2
MQILHYPQQPIVSTFSSQLLNYDELPSGQNAVVAIGVFTGYNQEDSIIVNRGALDMGLFRSTVYNTFKDSEKYGGTTDRDVFEKPDPERPTLGMQHANYDKLNPLDGIIDVGIGVDDVDAIIGKVMVSGASQKKTKQDTVYRDRSTLWQSFEHGVVDQVMMSAGVMKEDMRNVRVRVRSERIPEIGDKLSSRHGQKGVIGMIYPPEDMPYTLQGIVPDLIINPHCKFVFRIFALPLV